MPIAYLIVALSSLAGLTIAATALLKGWQGWLALKSRELDMHRPEIEGGAASGVARIEIAGKQFVLGIRCDRDLVLFRGPGAEVDQFAAIGAERPEFVSRSEFHGGATRWAFYGWDLAHDWPPLKVR